MSFFIKLSSVCFPNLTLKSAINLYEVGYPYGIMLKKVL